MSGQSFPATPTADYHEMARTMRLLGSAEADVSAVEGELYPRDADPGRAGT